MRAIDIIVSGKVQGVYFRASTKNQAINLKLTGGVKIKKMVVSSFMLKVMATNYKD